MLPHCHVVCWSLHWAIIIVSLIFFVDKRQLWMWMQGDDWEINRYMFVYTCVHVQQHVCACARVIVCASGVCPCMRVWVFWLLSYLTHRYVSVHSQCSDGVLVLGWGTRRLRYVKWGLQCSTSIHVCHVCTVILGGGGLPPLKICHFACHIICTFPPIKSSNWVTTPFAMKPWILWQKFIIIIKTHYYWRWLAY